MRLLSDNGSARTQWILALSVTWILLLATTCHGEPSSNSGDPARPNVLFVVIETLRKDHLELYGYEKSTAPNLTNFAKDAVIFDNAVAQSSWTIPSVATMFTSMYPTSHKFDVQHAEGAVLNPKVDTLAEVLKANGYKTGAFQTNVLLTPESGIAQGIDDYVYRETVLADHVVLGAKSWLEANGSEPFFLYLHLWDPHGPYRPPSQLHKRFMDDEKDIRPKAFFSSDYEHILLYENDELVRDLNVYRAFYDALIFNMDYEIRKLLQYLDDQGLTEDTLMVFIADHGEEFGDHGGLSHGFNLYEHVVGIPLFIRFPEAESGRVDTRVGAIDLAPTILDYLGIDAPSSWQGRSFVDLVTDPNAQHKPLEFSQLNGVGDVTKPRSDLEVNKVCVYEGRYKLIRSPSSGIDELYDLVQDPQEQENLAASKPDIVLKLGADIDAFLMYAERTSVDPEDTIQLDEEELEKLRSLGYVGGRKRK